MLSTLFGLYPRRFPPIVKKESPPDILCSRGRLKLFSPARAIPVAIYPVLMAPFTTGSEGHVRGRARRKNQGSSSGRQSKDHGDYPRSLGIIEHFANLFLLSASFGEVEWLLSPIGEREFLFSLVPRQPDSSLDHGVF